MADDEDLPEEGEEVPQIKRVVKATSEEQCIELIKDESHQKAVCVAWLLAKDKHSQLAAPWIEAAKEDPAFENMMILLCDPQELPEYAAKNDLCAVPTFQFYWHNELLHTFAGTNNAKFKAYMALTLKARHAELSIPKAWQREAKPEQEAKSGELVKFEELVPELRDYVLALGWEASAEAPTPEVEVVLTGSTGSWVSEKHILAGENRSVNGMELLGDTLKASGESTDDVAVKFNLDSLEPEVWEADIILTIPDAKEKEVTLSALGEVLYVRLYNKEANRCIFKFEVEEEALGENCNLIVGKLSRVDEKWAFKPVTEGNDLERDEFIAKYKPPVEKKKKVVKKKKTSEE